MTQGIINGLLNMVKFGGSMRWLPQSDEGCLVRSMR